MAILTTPRLALPYPNGAEDFNVAGDLQALADKLDGAALTDQGTIAQRPTSTPATPGIRGRLFYATDLGAVFYDVGTGWLALSPQRGTLAQRPAANQLPSGSLYFAADDHGGTLYLTDAVNWITLSAGANAPRVLRSGPLTGASSYTFTGLDGNVDRMLRLNYTGLLIRNGAERAIVALPNGTPTGWFDNVADELFVDASSVPQRSTPLHAGAGIGWRIGSTGYGEDSRVHGDATISTAVNGALRACRGTYGIHPNRATVFRVLGATVGDWENGTDNVTSLRVDFGGGTFTGSLVLERLER